MWLSGYGCRTYSTLRHLPVPLTPTGAGAAATSAYCHHTLCQGATRPTYVCAPPYRARIARRAAPCAHFLERLVRPPVPRAHRKRGRRRHEPRSRRRGHDDETRDHPTVSAPQPASRVAWSRAMAASTGGGRQGGRRGGGLCGADVAGRTGSAVAEFVAQSGGHKVIERVLIANNGIAAVKGIRSIRRWAYETFGNERAIEFVVMATPEDIKANADYIRMADSFVEVPGGSNNNNYANVNLIVELAERLGVQVRLPTASQERDPGTGLSGHCMGGCGARGCGPAGATRRRTPSCLTRCGRPRRRSRSWAPRARPCARSGTRYRPRSWRSRPTCRVCPGRAAASRYRARLLAAAASGR
jgi:hypothetical protein